MEMNESGSEQKKLCFIIRKQVFLYNIFFEKLFRSSVFIPLKNKINFKNLELVAKPNYHLPANFIPKSFQVKFLPTFTGNIGNSATIPLILWESMGCKEMDES